MKFVEPIRNRKKLTSMKILLREKSRRDHLMFTLGINSALRISDILNIKIKHVVDESGSILDGHSLYEVKTKKWKKFPYSENVRAAIKEYLAVREVHHPEEYLFVSREGVNRPITRQQAWRIINAAARDVGITDSIGTHTMRKTFAYHAHKSGASLSLIQKMLNHSSSAITMSYIGITQDDMDDVVRNLNL